MEETKMMIAASADTIRELVNFANEEHIKREDVVTLTKESNQFVLIYYK